jgi:hypothetical protein
LFDGVAAVGQGVGGRVSQRGGSDRPALGSSISNGVAEEGREKRGREEGEKGVSGRNRETAN